MKKSILNFNKGYLIYIAANRKNDVIVGITRSYELISVTESGQFSRLVYFKKYKRKKNAVSKMRTLTGYSNNELLSFVSDNNPEWLNLIQIFNEREVMFQTSEL